MQDAQTLLYDRYSVLHIERTNSFNKVFFVLDTYQSPPRSCTIKVFQPISEKLDIIQWIDREFPKEANRLKQLSLRNSHLPQIYTYSNDSRNYYIVRELIEGRTLREKVKATGEFSAQEVKEILTELLSVLEYLHTNGVIHQNIKPKNIVLRNSDNFPMLINFGSIKQIVSTYGFYGDKQIFSANNIYGYAPAELALGRSVAASDLYSLGLVAIYLLTGKNPVDFQTDSNSSRFKIPSAIASLDWNLARVINRAIKPNISDRYSSAKEMLDDLLDNNPQYQIGQIVEQPTEPKEIVENNTTSTNIVKSKTKEANNWQKMLFFVGSLYLIGNVIIALYDWNLSRNIVAPKLPEPSISLPPIPTELPPEESVEQPSMLNSKSKNAIEIPILPTGTPKQELRDILGQPNAIQPGYWENSSAWIYKDRANGSIDMGYLFDLDTDILRQTEVAIAPSVGLGTIEDILSSLLRGKTTEAIERGLQEIYQRQADEYTFELGNLSGSIEREDDDHIYLGVWESDFH